MNGQRPLRIAFLFDKFLPSRGGERYFSFLCQELAKRGHEVHVFATEVEADSNSSYAVHLVPVVRYPRSLRILSFLRNSRRTIKAEDFDIIHGVASSPLVNVFNPHGGVEQAYLKQEFSSIRSRLYRGYKLLKRYLFLRHYLEIWTQGEIYRGGRLKKVIAISQMIKGDVVHYYGLPEEKIDVIFNSVDLDRFHPANRERFRQPKRKALAIDDRTVVLLFAGNNFRLKGLETLLEALALLAERFPAQPLHLLVAGRGSAARYGRMARRLGITNLATFLGPVSGMEQYYGASDIYVHPTFYDSCSLTVLEALASGLPVVTSRFNGAADAITSDRYGRIVHDPGSAEELALSVAPFLDETVRSEARDLARAAVEPYSPARNLEETLRTYYAVASDKGGT